MGQFAGRPLALAGKDLRMYFRDIQMLFFSLALPVVLVGLMVAAFGGQTQFNATAYVVNLDQGAKGAELVERLDAVPEITVELLDEAEAADRLDRSNIYNVVIIGADFSQRLSAGDRPEVLIRHRGTGGTEGQIVNSYITAIARDLSGEVEVAENVHAALTGIGRTVARADVDAVVADLFDKTRANPPVTVTQEVVGARPEPVAIYLPGMVTMFTLFAISLTSVSLVEERKRGMLERLMTTRMTRGDLLTGTWLGAFGRGLVQIVVLFTLAWVTFRIFTPASFAAILAFGAVAVAAVAGIGLVIASVSRTPEQANWVAVFFTMIMTTLGGSFFDTTGLTGVMGALTRLTYNFWANDGFRRILMQGEALTSPAVVRDMAILAGIGLASWLVALALFRLRGDAK